MHYFQFNIGDYLSHTGHLSCLEDLAYRRLLEWQYLHEKPFIEDLREVSRLIRMVDHQVAVEQILTEFFTLTDEGHINNRVFADIEKYKKTILSASKAGKASAKARKVKVKQKVAESNDRSTTVQQESNDSSTNHKPLTINQEPLTKKQKPNNKSAFVLPDSINKKKWDSLMQIRVAKKAVQSDEALTTIVNKLLKMGGDADEALDNAIESSWKTVYPLNKINQARPDKVIRSGFTEQDYTKGL